MSRAGSHLYKISTPISSLVDDALTNWTPMKNTPASSEHSASKEPGRPIAASSHALSQVRETQQVCLSPSPDSQRKQGLCLPAGYALFYFLASVFVFGSCLLKSPTFRYYGGCVQETITKGHHRPEMWCGERVMLRGRSRFPLPLPPDIRMFLSMTFL